MQFHIHDLISILQQPYKIATFFIHSFIHSTKKEHLICVRHCFRHQNAGTNRTDKNSCLCETYILAEGITYLSYRWANSG